MDATVAGGDGDKAVGAYVHESRFGQWFLGTQTWAVHVVRRALDDLDRLIPDRKACYPVVLDVGCGWGHALEQLAERFAPKRLVGVDIDPAMVAAARLRAHRIGIDADVRHAPVSRLPVADGGVDLLFCHQTFHHFADQQSAIAEFHRVLKPGGLLLFAESTKAYIDTWLIRLLFRHPMAVQKTAAQYLALIRGAGFVVPAESISYPYLWWSRADLGLAERLLGIAPPQQREETLINLVARRR